MERRESQISGFIKRYPFNGRSKYLIDKFYIIGYNSPTLNKLLFSNDNDNNLSKYIILDEIEEEKNKSSLNNLQSFHFEEEPIILNELTSDFSKKCLNYDIMKEMIFPNKLSLYYLEEEIPSSNKEKEKSKNRIDIVNNNDDFILYEKHKENDSKLLKTSYVVFSTNPQAENNTKKSINGFAYIFYKKLKRKKITSKKIYSFYIPVIFTIVSEYPFYNSYYKLCDQIKILFNLPNNEIPIEIMLYNIIKFTESPINGNVLLSIKPFLFNFNKNKIKQINSMKIDTEIKEENNDDEDIKDKTLDDFSLMNKKGTLTNENKINDNENSFSKNFIKRNTEIISNNKIFNFGKSGNDKIKSSKSGNIFSSFRKNKKVTNNSNGVEEEINLDKFFPNIKFDLLPGYPLIQYNLAKVLLDTMSPMHVIEIFFYTFLEKNVIFFSKNLKLLSLTINSYMNLNFPLNDEKYYFINASVSLENYINNNSPFIGATFTNMLGINSSYNTKYLNSTNKLTEHIAIDLDKDEINNVNNKGKINKIKGDEKELLNYIKKICKKEVKNEKSRTILAKEVYLLYKKLNDINNLLHSDDDELESNEAFKLFKNEDYLVYDDSKDNYIKKQNIEIQNSFYRLINNLCLYFYKNLFLNIKGDDKKKNENKKNDPKEMNVIFRDDYKDDDENAYINEEKFFLEELRQTMKFESFVYCFIQSYSPIDLYKIPLTFTEEFLSIMSRKSSILEKDINFFEIIDKLYSQKIMTNSVDFLPFFVFYYKEFKDEFEREIEEMQDKNLFNQELIKIKYSYDKYKKNKYLLYNDYQLDNNLLMKYLNKINNLEKEHFNNIFYMTDSINKNESKNILVIDIEDLIEKYSIENHLLSSSDLCCSTIMLLFSLSLKFLEESNDCNGFLENLFQHFTIFRKYYSYINNMIYALFNNYLKNKDYTRAQFYLFLYYICVNNIRRFKLIPNESLLNIMKKFDNLDLEKFDKEFKNQNKNNSIKNKENLIEKNENEKITKINLYPIYNFTNKKIMTENEILDVIEKELYKKDTKTKFHPKIRFQNNISNIQADFFRQFEILNKLVNTYNNFITDLDEKNLDYKIVLDCCMNILIYIRNSDDFRNLNEIINFVEVIFFLFLNKYNKKNN